jgi:hypothetical protein
MLHFFLAQINTLRRCIYIKGSYDKLIVRAHFLYKNPPDIKPEGKVVVMNEK